MADKITRREALKGLLFAGMGIATGGMLLKSQGAAARPATPSAPWKEAPEGSKIDTRTWDKLGETLLVLGRVSKTLPTKPGSRGVYGRKQPPDQ